MIKKVLIFIPLYIVWVGTVGYSVFGLCRACLGPGLLELLSIVGYLVLILIPIWLFIHWISASPRWMKKVEANGIQATATILEIKNTGMVINNTVAVVKLQLRVEPPNDVPFEVSQEKQISMLAGLGGYSIGALLRVKYDPDSKNHVIIMSNPDTTSGDSAKPSSAVSGAFSASSDVTQELKELSKLHTSGELSDSEFVAAKKKLLG